MKKKLFLLLIVITTFLTGCGSMKMASDDTYKNILKQKKMAAYSVLNQLPDNINCESATVGMDSDKYQIDYLIFKNVSDAKDVYNNNKNIFSVEKNITDKDVNSDNYQKYYSITDNKYMIVVRFDKAVLYANVKKEYMDNVNDIINELGY